MLRGAATVVLYSLSQSDSASAVFIMLQINKFNLRIQFHKQTDIISSKQKEGEAVV